METVAARIRLRPILCSTRLLQHKHDVAGVVSLWRCTKRCYCEAKDGESRNIPSVAAVSKLTGKFHLDTLKVANELQLSGFTPEQARVLTELLVEITTSTMETVKKSAVTKPQQEIMVQQLLSQIASVKKDMVILEKSEFTMIRNETEKQGIHIKHLEEMLDDEVKKLAGQVKLDINLEKGRAIEAHAINENNLQSLRNRLDVEHAQTEKNLHSLENMIDIKVSELRTQTEKHRNDVLKYMIGLAFSAASVMLAYLRFRS